MFSEEQLLRYSRQLLLGPVGGAGQRRLLESAVLVLGAGAIGSPLLLYLAGAGVGRLTIVDPLPVAAGDAPRQPLHAPARVGAWRGESARDALMALNPDVVVEPLAALPGGAALPALLRRHHLVVAADDAGVAWRGLNAPCREAAAALLAGGVIPTGGWLALSAPGGERATPCLGCVPPLAETGPLGGERPPANGGDDALAALLPGVVGSRLALEGLRWLLGMGPHPVRAWFPLERGGWQDVPLAGGAGCPLCGCGNG